MNTLTDLVGWLMAYADNKANIAECQARGQQAPKYLYEQAGYAIEHAKAIAAELEERYTS